MEPGYSSKVLALLGCTEGGELLGQCKLPNEMDFKQQFVTQSKIPTSNHVHLNPQASISSFDKM